MAHNKIASMTVHKKHFIMKEINEFLVQNEMTFEELWGWVKENFEGNLDIKKEYTKTELSSMYKDDLIELILNSQ